MTNCFVHFDGWGRFASPAAEHDDFARMEAAVIVTETAKRFRVLFLEEWPRGDKGDVVLVPKWAVTTKEQP